MSLASGKDYSGVDIFLSSEWPQNVWHYTAQPVRGYYLYLITFTK
jgi:hypothetical protein